MSCSKLSLVVLEVSAALQSIPPFPRADPETAPSPQLVAARLPRSATIVVGDALDLWSKDCSPKNQVFTWKEKRGTSLANCLVVFSLYIHVVFPHVLGWFRVTVCSFMFQTHVLMLQYINPSIETMKQFIRVFVAQGRILILVLRCTWNHPQRQMIPLTLPPH